MYSGYMNETRDVILRLCPPTKEMMDQYLEAARLRDYIELQGTPDGYIIVGDQDGRLVAAVSIFPSGGRYVLFEDAVSMPGWHPKVAYRAGEIIIEEILAYCAVRDKIPVCPVTAKSIARVMEKRFGFEAIPSVVLRKKPEPLGREVVRLTRSKPKPVEEDGVYYANGEFVTEDHPPPEPPPEAQPEKRKAVRRDFEV